MSTELAQALYENIGKITHLRTFEFLKAIEENRDPDGFSRLSYAKWRDQYRIHAFILNECTHEAVKLGFIQVARENKNGIAENGGKGTKRIYKLTISRAGSITNNVESKPDNISPITEPEPAIPEVVEPKNSAMPTTKFSKGKKVSADKLKYGSKAPAKNAARSVPKKEPSKQKAPISKRPAKKVTKKK